MAISEPIVSMFSLVIRVVTEPMNVAQADAVCDRCGWEIRVNSPKHAEDMLNNLIYHMSTCTHQKFKVPIDGFRHQ